jgi:hypothetical protein
LTVRDLVDGSSIAGVAVKMSVGGRIFADGITNRDGVFRGTSGQQNATALIEYELIGYLRRPERKTVAIGSGDLSVSGTLLKETTQSAYVIGIPHAIDQVATEASSVDKKTVYVLEWDRVTLLPADAQKSIGLELLKGDAKVYLADVPSFRKVTGS